jgi:hypothetical protein
MMAVPPPLPLPVVRIALVRKLEREYLSVRWARCYRDAKTYRSLRVTRCKVNFGDPHIVQYCVVFIGRRLVTDHDLRAIRCGVHPDPTLSGTAAQHLVAREG